MVWCVRRLVFVCMFVSVHVCALGELEWGLWLFGHHREGWVICALCMTVWVSECALMQVRERMGLCFYLSDQRIIRLNHP